MTSVLLFLLLLLAVPAAAGPLDHPGYTKAFTCSACHGFGGNSRSDSMPILAGMPAGYLRKALEDYAAGKRPSPEMEPYAKMAIGLGVADVAGYFAAQTCEATPVTIDPASATRGKAAAAACAACHGADGRGDSAKLVPGLAGQPPGYLASQIRLFKADRRSPGDEALKQVKAMMKSLPDSAVPDVAAYYSSLRCTDRR